MSRGNHAANAPLAPGHLSRPAFYSNHLTLLSLPHAELHEEYLHEYFTHTSFAIRKNHNSRNLALETGLILLREANITRIRMLAIELDGWLTVSLAFRGSRG